MKKLILASASSIAMLGLAACSDTDTTTTQGLPEEDPAVQAPATDPAATTEPTQTDELAPEAPAAD
jgi:ABC-type oligopeptide transport system substrate-binding subunit